MPNDDAVNASYGGMDEINCELEEFKLMTKPAGESSQLSEVAVGVNLKDLVDNPNYIHCLESIITCSRTVVRRNGSN